MYCCADWILILDSPAEQSGPKGFVLDQFLNTRKKHDIFVFFLVMCHVWTPFWTLKLLPFIESVQKRGSKNGPDGRTDVRTYERT